MKIPLLPRVRHRLSCALVRYVMLLAPTFVFCAFGAFYKGRGFAPISLLHFCKKMGSSLPHLLFKFHNGLTGVIRGTRGESF